MEEGAWDKIKGDERINMKIFKTLHIIGNGFDLAHGIASRYIDFKDYAWKHGDQYQMGLLETCYPDINPQKNELELWCDLEKH